MQVGVQTVGVMDLGVLNFQHLLKESYCFIGNETPRTDFTFVIPDNPLGSLALSLNGAGVEFKLTETILLTQLKMQWLQQPWY